MMTTVWSLHMPYVVQLFNCGHRYNTI